MTATAQVNDRQELIDTARDAVRCHAICLSQSFHSLTARLPEAVLLKEALRRLEDEAARLDYEPLSRIAAVLHDVLRYNAIEEFSGDMLAGFVEALQQVTEVRADQADPFTCELALYKAGLDWLPPIPVFEEPEAWYENEDTGDEE